jgi:cytochrome c oxidase subunit II
MNYIIGLLSAVFLVLAIMIVNKSMALSKGLQRNEEESGYSPVDGANKNNALGMLLFLVLGSIGAAWSFKVSQPDFLPEAASEHGLKTDEMFWTSMAVITFAFFVTNALLFYFAFRYQWKKDRVATFYPVNHKLEIIWTIVPAIVMAVLVFTGWRTWSEITSQAPSNAVVVELTGKQFNWLVRYAGNDDNKLGEYDWRLIDDNNQWGMKFDDENSFDDFTSTSEIHIPKGVPVLLRIRARDVLHSVYLSYQRVKMDAVPGMPTKFWFKATKTTEEMRAELQKPDFNYKLNCTEVCGRGHFGMALTLIVDEPEDYKKWCLEQKPFLTTNPDYLAKVPEKLKAKASKYIVAPEASSDSTTASVGATSTIVTLK